MATPLQYSCLENPRDGGIWWAPSMGSHRVGHDGSDLAAAAAATHLLYILIWNKVQISGIVIFIYFTEIIGQRIIFIKEGEIL